MDQLLGLALEQPVDRDARPAGDDGGDVVLVDLLLDHRVLGPRALGELALERRDLAVADLGDALQVAVALGALGLHPQLVEAARRLLDPLERLLLAAPSARRGRRGASFASASARSSGSRTLADSFAIAASSISSCITRRFASSSSIGEESISIRRPRGGLVDEVDRLVGQEAVGDVAVREHRGGDERRVADPDAVMGLVALLQPAQDRDRVLDRRLVDVAPARSAARAPRPSRCACGTRRASSRRRSGARRARASASAGSRRRRRPRRRRRRRSCAARR